MNVKDELQNLLCTSGRKHYTRALKRTPELLAELKQSWGNLPLPELFYLGINGGKPYCKLGNRRKFKNIDEGYRQFCGTGKQCPCRLESHSQKIKSVWDNRSEEEKAELWDKYRQTNREKYGVDNPALNEEVKRKTAATNTERYGAATPLQADTIQSKTQDTISKRYGVKYPFQSKNIRDKAKLTFRKNNPDVADSMQLAREGAYRKYDGKNPFTDPEVKEKIRQKVKERYGADHIKTIHLDPETIRVLRDPFELQDLLQKYTFKNAAEYLHVDPTTLSRWCAKYDLLDERQFEQSYQESKIAEYIERLGFKVVRNTRQFIPPKEIDILIPERKIAVEYCGLYWHSDKGGKRDKQYHLEKLRNVEEKGYRLITIFEDEWMNKPDIVKSTLAHTLGVNNAAPIYARKCKVKEINKSDASAFFRDNHLIGGDLFAYHFLGLFDTNNNLVACMAFCRTQPTIEHKNLGFKEAWQLVRFATNKSKVSGAAGKLLKHFERNQKWDIIYTYADCRWSTGDLYHQLGFTNDSFDPPGKWYLSANYKTRYHYTIGRKKKWRHKYDIENLTEDEIMNAEGYDRIWDCGKLRFVKTKN